MINALLELRRLHHLSNSMSRPKKRFYSGLTDLTLMVLSGVLSLQFVLPMISPEKQWLFYLWAYGCRIVIIGLLFAYVGLYRLVLSGSEGQSAYAIWISVFLYLCFGLAFVAVIGDLWLSFWLVIDACLVAFVCMGWRLLVVRNLGLREGHKSVLAKRSLIYGAGEAGKQLANALRSSSRHILCGFIDDSIDLHGQEVLGVSVIPYEGAIEFIRANDIAELMVAIPSLSEERRRQVFDKIESLPVRIRTLPGLLDLADGVPTISDLSEIKIEDLLHREPTCPDESLLSAQVCGRVVMVTGAGGSIGSELCRQILRRKPSVLILFELSESALYQIDDSLNTLIRTFGNENHLAETESTIIPISGSVTDESLIDHILGAWKPHIIYHAAAMKHVPIVERNVSFAVKNNVFGMVNLTRLVLKHQINNFVLISSDKAVNPTNVMGATKRVCEHVLQSLGHITQFKFDPAHAEKSKYGIDSTNGFCIVRFGNVLGSSGSVVPKFQKQIDELRPITLTHREIERYFMTTEEAVQLVLQASAMSTKNPGRVDVYILDMGVPVKIYDLAKRMIKLSGLSIKDDANKQGDIEIKITGLRPGEKLFEELALGNAVLQTEHPRIARVEENFIPWSELESKLDQIKAAIDSNEVKRIIETLEQVVEGYNPHKEIEDYIYQESIKTRTGKP